MTANSAQLLSRIELVLSLKLPRLGTEAPLATLYDVPLQSKPEYRVIALP
jgi:hypothetical protein